MNRHKSISAIHTRQSGASLVVALVLISVSTLVGVSVMRSSNLGTQLVNNDKFQQLTFRAAESSASPVATEANIALLSQNNSTDCIASVESVDAKITVGAQLCPYGFGIAEGYRIGEGIPSFQMSHFSVVTDATLEGVNTKTSLIQGSQHLSLKQ